VSVRERITVLVAQGDDVAREEIEAILAGAEDMEVVGVARTGEAALALARKLTPAIVLVDYDLPGPGGGDGIATTEAVTALLPGVGVIVTAAELSAEALRRAMMAGARQFVQAPPRPEELVRAIYQVSDTTTRRAASGAGALRPPEAGEAEPARAGQVVAVFSPKGGVGTTTVATNLAVAIRREAGLRVALVDGALPFGDVGVFMDLPPTRSIMDLQALTDGGPEGLEAEFVETALVTHERSGVRVLLAPARPELADMVTGELLRRAVGALRRRAEYVVVDTWAALDERVLTVLEAADRVVLVTAPDLAALKGAKVFLEVAELLQFPREKVIPVLTRATAPAGITVADVAATLGRPVEVCIPSDERGVLRAINEGDPVVLGGRGTPVAVAITALAHRIVAESYPELHTAPAAAPATHPRAGRFKLFARA
jgi:pilus assembly protein CpaE